MNLIEKVVVVGFMAAVFFTGIDAVPFHPDESQWIATSYVFEEYIHGRFSSSAWNESYWTLTQPPVTRYVIGFGRRMGGYRVIDLNKPWAWSKEIDANIREGAMPSTALLWWSRWPMAVLTVFSILIGYRLAKKTVGRPAGMIWLILCGISPYLMITLRRAMGEASLLAGIMLAVFAGHRALQAAAANDRKRLLKTGLWLGVFSVSTGLAGASKLNGLSALAAGFVMVAMMGIKLKRPQQPPMLYIVWALLMMTLPAFFVFTGLNPYLWPQPIGRSVKMLEHRVGEMATQQVNYEESQIETVRERVRVIPERMFQTHAAVKSVPYLNMLFFMVGLGIALAHSWKWLTDKVADSGLLAVLLVGWATMTPSLFTPLDWDRYYLLPVFFTTFFIALGIDWTLRKAYQLWRMGGMQSRSL